MTRGQISLVQKQGSLREKNPHVASGFVPSSEAFAEKHYAVAEVAKMWNISRDLTRSMFEKEPGVLVLEGDGSRQHGRRYRTLRIPESVVARVHRRLCNVGRL